VGQNKSEVSAGGDPILSELVYCLENIECVSIFENHRGQPQSEQGKLVRDFQNLVKAHLQSQTGLLKNVDWEQERRPIPDQGDSVDIFGTGDNFVVAIELDAHRADQVAKKFVSRMALLPIDKTIYYVSLCYPGTKRMSKKECKKYFGYCSVLARRMGTHYAGIFVGQPTAVTISPTSITPS
jgi:hypothetical protein